MRYQLSFLLLAAVGLCHAQTQVSAPSAAEERARLHHERQVVEQALAHAEAACYQRFAVEDCLRQARQTARTAQTDLRQQEAVINEAERRRRAAQRLEDIAERERNRSVPALMPPRIKEAPPAAQPLESEAAAPLPEAVKNPAALAAEREQQARQRARQQQQKRKAHQANQAEAVSAQAAAAANARQQREAKNAAAAQRRARLLQSQADDAAAGRVPAAPLSPAP